MYTDFASLNILDLWSPKGVSKLSSSMKLLSPNKHWWMNKAQVKQLDPSMGSM
jgi:hypothetical protein